MANKLLKRKGYEILKRNYKLSIGEIDIIAKDGECLVFVEVKTRLNMQFGKPFEAVNAAKQKKIRRLAEAFLLQKDLCFNGVRFDVISILIGPEKTTIEHIKNAF
ncbi:MAG: YraN family protein [Actinomycetota bacterium]|nr:YraN family protein [Actinomycetota bacterium]